MWTRAVGTVGGSPAVADGVVYVGDNSGHVQAFGVESGEKRWERSVDSAVDASPAVVDGTLSVSTATDLRALE